jgi:flagellin-like hook-associated protein FlgL
MNASTLQMGDSALGELTNISTRILELAQQSANGTLFRRQRMHLDGEVGELVDEYNRILQTTTFNGVKLTTMEDRAFQVQIGYGDNGFLQHNLNQSLKTYAGSGQSTRTLSEAGQFGGTTAGDFNGDGNVDIVSINSSADGIVFNRGNGNGTFKAGVSTALAGARVSSGQAEAECADMDGDGNLDLIFAKSTGGSAVAWGDGAGGFSALTSVGGVANRLGIEIGDLNNDGRLDFLAANSAASSILINNGSRSFTETILTGSYGTEAAMADFDGDGNLDVAFSNASVGSVPLSIRRGDGLGNLSATATTLTASMTAVGGLSAGDLDGDGLTDLVVVQGTTATVFKNTGEGTISFTQSQTFTVSSVNGISLQDFNNDGRLDLWGRQVSANYFVGLGNGDGTFGATTSYAMTGGFAARDEAFADFNNDGVMDFSLARGGDASAWVLRASETTALKDLHINTVNDAKTVITLMNDLIARIARERGQIGSSLSRFDSALSTLGAYRDNVAAANERIVGIDVAEESAAYARTQILKQVGAAVLAQANQSPALALQLLKI